jgi:uncharacterized integral membrane protein
MRLNYGLHELDEALPFIMELLPILIPILIINIIVMIAAIVNMVKKDLPFGDKVLWLIIVIFGQLTGAVIYFAVGSKMLDNKLENRGENNK